MENYLRRNSLATDPISRQSKTFTFSQNYLSASHEMIEHIRLKSEEYRN